MSRESPFAGNFQQRAWPLLLQSCSFPQDPAKISPLAAQIHDAESLIRLADEHGVIAHLATALAAVPEAGVSTGLLDSLRSRQRRSTISRTETGLPLQQLITPWQSGFSINRAKCDATSLTGM